MKNHNLWMIVACVVPLLLIFFLPVFGATGGESLFLFLILCFGMHLLMMGHHGDHGHHDEDHDEKHLDTHKKHRTG